MAPLTIFQNSQYNWQGQMDLLERGWWQRIGMSDSKRNELTHVSTRNKDNIKIKAYIVVVSVAMADWMTEQVKQTTLRTSWNALSTSFYMNMPMCSYCLIFIRAFIGNKFPVCLSLFHSTSIELQGYLCVWLIFDVCFIWFYRSVCLFTPENVNESQDSSLLLYTPTIYPRYINSVSAHIKYIWTTTPNVFSAGFGLY